MMILLYLSLGVVNGLLRSEFSQRNTQNILRSTAAITSPLKKERVVVSPKKSATEKVKHYLDGIILQNERLHLFERKIVEKRSIVKPDDLPWQTKALPVKKTENEFLWKSALLAICICWATNFALLKYGVSELPSTHPATGALFVAARFGVASLVCLPFLFKTSAEVLKVGARIGAWCAFGYAAQAIALNSFHISASETAFECSLQTVVVAAWLGAQRGHISQRTIASVSTAVIGVAVLCFAGSDASSSMQAPTHFEAIAGAMIALGQAVGFGASYIELEEASEKFPDEAEALAAIQCIVVAAFALAAARCSGADLPAVQTFTNDVMNSPTALASLLWMGLISTSFTIWLQAKAFAQVNSQDASLILTSEPVWAALCARLLLAESLNFYQLMGGAAVLAATAIHDGFIPLPFLAQEQIPCTHEKNTHEES